MSQYNRPWTVAENDYLTKHAGHLPPVVMAHHLRRSITALHMQAHKWGVSLVAHICHQGHPMQQRANGSYRCMVCRGLREKARRDAIKTK